MSAAAFFVLAAITIFCALWVVSGRNLFHNVLMLSVFLGGIAGLYLLAGADFVALAQVMVYVGGVVVLVLFAIMLTLEVTDIHLTQTSHHNVLAAFVAVGMGLVMTLVAKTTPFGAAPQGRPIASTVAVIGTSVTKEWIVAFEVVGLILLVGLVGALLVGRKEQP